MSVYDDEDDELSPLAVPKAAVPIGTSLMPALAARPLEDFQGDMHAAGPQVPAAPVMATQPKGPTPIGGSQLDQDQAEVNRLKSTGSGVDQFGQHHNKFLSGLAHVADALGSGLAPGIAANIPGTTAHHQMLLGRAQGAVNNDQEGILKAAQATQEQAKATQEQAKAKELTDPQAKPKEEQWDVVPNMQGPNGEPIEYEKSSGQVRVANVPGAQRVPKEETEGKTVTTADGVMQWNPQTKAYDKRVGDAPAKEGNDFEQYYKDFLKDHSAPDNSHNRLLARQQYSAASQPPQREPQQMMVVPTTDGGSQVVAMRPGMTIPKGGVTVGGYNKGVEDDNKQTKADAKAAQDADSELSLMKQFAAQPSATNDTAMLMHFIGATKPESMGKIRLNENEIKLFGGTRSSLGDMQALLQKTQNGQSLTPKQRQDMINTMQMISSAAHRGGGSSSGAVEEYVRDPQTGKLVKK